jgi:hypothetical protein
LVNRDSAFPRPAFDRGARKRHEAWAALTGSALRDMLRTSKLDQSE